MSKRPRVLHVQTDTGLSGGIASYISKLVRAPELASFRMVAVVPACALDPTRTREMYGETLAVALPSSYGLRTWHSYVQALQRLVSENGVALMHAHALRSALACAWVSQRTRVPFVYTNHGLRYTQKAPGLAQRVFRAAEAWVCKHAQAVVAIRPFDSARLQQAGLVAAERLHTIQTRIDTPADPSEGNTIRAWPPRMVGVGSLIEVKRPDRFIEWAGALQQLGLPVHAIWIGDGPLRQQMQELANRLGVDIKWRGHLGAKEVAAELTQASVLALSSQFEVFPLAVLEAYSQGVPVVTGHFDGVEDFLEDNCTGLIVSADEPQQVAQAIASLAHDRERWQAFSDRARQMFAHRFEGRARMAADYAALYRACLP